jgi:sialic acid synthase SpsE
MIFVAEISSNHKGIPALAYQYIRQSSLAGATIVKFQLGHYDGSSASQEMRRWPTNNAKWLKEACDEWGVEFMASLFSHEGLRIARKIGQNRYKFASRVAFSHHSDLDYDEFLTEILKDGKETFISDNTSRPEPNARMLYCIPEYPTYPKQFAMPPFYGVDGYYGYSGHVHGIEDALLAIARGAKLIEKHTTLNPTEASIKDNHFAISFGEFANLVQLGKRIERLVEHSNGSR